MITTTLPFFILLAAPGKTTAPPASSAAASAAAANAPAPNALEERIAREAQALRPKLVETRRDFHQHPELSNREERTSRVVAERLRALGLEDIRTGVGKYGVTALVRGGKPGPVVAVRADMDALPIDEAGNAPWKSTVKGVKHACGHDLHMTVGLGTAELLMKLRAELPGTVKFIFQPAEESPPPGEEGGAPLMIKEGALEHPRPAAIYALHSWPLVEVGRIAWSAPAALASSDRFLVTIHGKRSHGSAPHLGTDAIPIAAEVVTALQTIRSRRIDTMDPVVVTVGTIHGGDRYNILADEVKLEGTVRALDESVRQKAKDLIKEITAGVCKAHGATFDLRYDDLNPVTLNDVALVDESLPALRRAVGTDRVIVHRTPMGAEDFAHIAKIVPGFYFFLGVANKQKGITAMIHTAEFEIDEDALVIGVRAMSGVVADYLVRHAK